MSIRTNAGTSAAVHTKEVVAFLPSGAAVTRSPETQRSRHTLAPPVRVSGPTHSGTAPDEEAPERTVALEDFHLQLPPGITAHIYSHGDPGS